MRIESHKIAGVEYLPSPNHSGRITPTFIVEHYTAGFSLDSAVSWLRNPTARASAHVVIGNDGEVVQLVPFNIKAWHAGPSRHAGVSGLNDHSIGIEITNVGWLRLQPDGTYRDWLFYDKRLKSRAQVYREGEGPLAGRELIPQAHPRVGGGMLYWPTYTDAQLDAVEEVTAACIGAYPIKDVLSHEEIDTRGWKTDPGPAFPMQRMKRLLGNDRGDGEAPPATGGEELRIKKALQGIDDTARDALAKGWTPDLTGDLQKDRWALAAIREIIKDRIGD